MQQDRGPCIESSVNFLDFYFSSFFHCRHWNCNDFLVIDLRVCFYLLPMHTQKYSRANTSTCSRFVFFCVHILHSFHFSVVLRLVEHKHKMLHSLTNFFFRCRFLHVSFTVCSCTYWSTQITPLSISLFLSHSLSRTQSHSVAIQSISFDKYCLDYFAPTTDVRQRPRQPTIAQNTNTHSSNKKKTERKTEGIRNPQIPLINKYNEWKYYRFCQLNCLYACVCVNAAICSKAKTFVQLHLHSPAIKSNMQFIYAKRTVELSSALITVFPLILFHSNRIRTWYTEWHHRKYVKYLLLLLLFFSSSLLPRLLVKLNPTLVCRNNIHIHMHDIHTRKHTHTGTPRPSA